MRRRLKALVCLVVFLAGCGSDRIISAARADEGAPLANGRASAGNASRALLDRVRAVPTERLFETDLSFNDSSAWRCAHQPQWACRAAIARELTRPPAGDVEAIVQSLETSCRAGETLACGLACE